ncbi:hypothetical protein ScPMuIL_000102 [Solemya velum]
MVYFSVINCSGLAPRIKLPHSTVSNMNKYTKTLVIGACKCLMTLLVMSTMLVIYGLFENSPAHTRKTESFRSITARVGQHTNQVSLL